MSVKIFNHDHIVQKKHALKSIFHQFPAKMGSAKLRNGVQCAIPYHNYDANALILWGTASAQWVSERILGPWEPILDPQGRANIALWLVDYKDTVVDPYKELIIVFSVRHKTDPAIVVNRPLQQLQLFDDKQAYPYIYKLWLDTQLPIDYGRELLGCDKYLDEDMELSFSSSEACFSFYHVADERNSPEPGLLLSGTLQLKDKLHLRDLIDAYGFFRTLGMAKGASNRWHVVTPPGIMSREDTERYNPIWDFVYETQPKFTLAQPSDALQFGGELKEMDFVPQLYQHDPHIKAVLLPPHSFSLID